MTTPSSTTPEPSPREGRRWGWALLSVLVVMVGLGLLVFGQRFFDLDSETVAAWLGAIKESPWSLVLVIALYGGLAFTGFPQALLFAGTAAVFGGGVGALYSWCATMVSSALTFGLGRAFGARWVEGLSGGRAQTFIGLVRRRGILAAMVVRWTPSAPFIVVNAASGSSGMAYWKFALGTGIGIIPKIAIISFFTDQLDALVAVLQAGDARAILGFALIIALWAGFLWFCRGLYQKLKRTTGAGLSSRTDVAPKLLERDGDSDVSLNKKSKAP